ncbi:hypothetical protein [Bradyrhizobium nitroreducens]|nr:hypothetical protein [Bradyrhizobium nitroreducens]
MPRQRLRNLIQKQPAATPYLPLVHTTDVYRMTNVLEDGVLEPRECDVFKGEPLLYFFYGRPSYRINSNEGATGLDHYLPVCILFRSNAVAPIKRIFPFDSGGFHRALYADAFHKDMRLDDFGLEPNTDTPGRVISLFFESADAYLRARSAPAVSLDPSELEAKSYLALISQRLSNTMDNRVSGIELQFEGPLAIDGAIEAIILPDTLYCSPFIQSKLTRSKIEALPYPQIDRQRPSEYVTKIFDLCFEYYRRSGLMK